MNILELKTALEPIVCDLRLTKEQRTERLAPIAGEWLSANPDLDNETVFNQWNMVMVEIVDENNLARQ